MNPDLLNPDFLAIKDLFSPLSSYLSFFLLIKGILGRITTAKNCNCSQ